MIIVARRPLLPIAVPNQPVAYPPDPHP